MSNADARAQLQRIIDRIRSLPAGLGKSAAPEVAKALDEEISKDIADGVSPDGEPWKRTLDGKQPLRNAKRAVTVTHEGSVVLARLSGPEAKHHKGTARGRTQRRILPTRNMPQPLVRATTRILKNKFREWFE